MLSPLRYQYILGERTWIEYWPTKIECQSNMRPTCMGLEEMEQQYTIFGCQGKWKSKTKNKKVFISNSFHFAWLLILKCFTAIRYKGSRLKCCNALIRFTWPPVSCNPVHQQMRLSPSALSILVLQIPKFYQLVILTILILL